MTGNDLYNKLSGTRAKLQSRAAHLRSLHADKLRAGETLTDSDRREWRTIMTEVALEIQPYLGWHVEELMAWQPVILDAARHAMERILD